MKIPTSKRARRLGVEIQKVAAEQLRRLVEPRVPGSMVTVSEVRVSDDLKHAAVYCSVRCEDNENKERVYKEILKMAGKVKKAAAEMIRIKKLPEFRFVWDDTMERADRIEQLLNQIHNSQSPPTEENGADS